MSSSIIIGIIDRLVGMRKLLGVLLNDVVEEKVGRGGWGVVPRQFVDVIFVYFGLISSWNLYSFYLMICLAEFCHGR